MKVFVRKVVFVVLGMVVLCLPATVFAEPLDSGVVAKESEKQTIEAPRLSKDVASLDKELLVSIGHDTAILDPNAPYEIFLDDVSLGTYTSDANGQLFVQVKIPKNTKPGSHLLSVNIEQKLLQKIIQLI